MEDHLLQLCRDRRVRGTTDRGLGYAVGDLRGEREQRLDGSQRDPERSDCVHVVLLRSSDADTRLACELHTHRVWQSHADANGESDCDSHSYCNCLAYGHSYSYTDSYGYGYRYCDSYCYGYGYCYGYSDVHAYTDANAHDPAEG